MKRVMSFAFVAVVLCSSGSCSGQTSASTPEKVFEIVWRTFDERYALFEVKSIDWGNLGDEYRSQVTAKTSEEELFDIITGMLSHLNDNHVTLSAETLGRDFCAGFLGSYFNEVGFSAAMEILQQRPMPDTYFQTTPREVGDSGFLYGLVGDGIGYFHFGGFEDVNKSAAAVDEILEVFGDARAMIVDVRHNSGGDDRVGKAIADRFADMKRPYMVTRDRNGPNHDDFAEPKYWHVEPAERTFTGPVVLLTSRLSISAAENFALAMKVLPHVTIVGDTTSGCFADNEWHDLPNGWRFSLSKNLFVDSDGRCWEGVGVPPDIKVEGNGAEGEADPVVDFALHFLRNGASPPKDESTCTEAVRGS